MNHRGSGSSVKLWCHRHRGAQLSIKFGQALHQHGFIFFIYEN